MKILMVFFLLALGLNAQVSFDELLDCREWTSSEGKKLEAELVLVTDKYIEIKRKKDGTSFKLKPEMLSKKDRKLLSEAKEYLLTASKVMDQQSNHPLVRELGKLSTWRLAVPLGIFDEMKNTVVSINNPAVTGNPPITVSLGSMLLGSGLGSLGDTGGRNKEFLFRTSDEDVHVRVVGDNISQKGQKLVSILNSVEAGGSTAVSLAAMNLSLERVGARERLVITKMLK